MRGIPKNCKNWWAAESTEKGTTSELKEIRRSTHAKAKRLFEESTFPISGNFHHRNRQKVRAPISLPIWFVWNDDKLYLLPVKGSDTQWYKNVLSNPLMQIEAGGARGKFQATPLTDKTDVSPVIERFRAKYAGDVKKYYSKFDVAVVAQ